MHLACFSKRDRCAQEGQVHLVRNGHDLDGTALLCEMYQMYLSLLVPWNACRPLK